MDELRSTIVLQKETIRILSTHAPTSHEPQSLQCWQHVEKLSKTPNTCAANMLCRTDI